jgi:hypothetical protein
MGGSVMHAKRELLDDTVRDIVNILVRTGLTEPVRAGPPVDGVEAPLRPPRPFSYVPENATEAQLKEVARNEVQHSIKRARGVALPAEFLDYFKKASADIRKAKKLLQPHMPKTVSLDRLIQITPGSRTHFLKYRCAKEALFLARTLSRAKISADQNGVVYQIALLIYQANGGGPDDTDMRNAVRMVVEDWKATGCP